jgi:CBS domain-containing protein
MHVIEGTRRSAVGVAPDRTITSVASLMATANVGAVAVIEGTKLVGIVTDRDLVRRALASRLAPDARVDAVMTTPVISIDAHADLRDAFRAFAENAIRRLAITDDGAFVGMISVDDLLIDLAGDLAALARPITAETVFGHHDASVPAVS